MPDLTPNQSQPQTESVQPQGPAQDQPTQQPAMQDAQQPTTDQTVAAQPDTSNLPATSNVPQTMPQQAPKPPILQHASVLHEIAQTLAGGPRYKPVIDVQTGKRTLQEVPMNRKDIGMAIALSALSGSLAGLSAKGPNANAQAAGMGFNQTMQQNKEVNQEQEAQAQADFARQTQIAHTNFQMHNNAMALGKQSFDMNQAYVSQFADLYKRLQGTQPDAIQGVVPESQLAKYHVTKDNAIPVGVVKRTDPSTGQQVVDSYGVPQWDIDYAIVDPSRIMDLSDDDKAEGVKYGLKGFVNGDGNPITLPQSVQLKLGTILNQKARIGALRIAEGDLSNYYKTLNNPAEANIPVWGLFPDTDHLADFITHHEGGEPDSRNIRNNNPGNIKATSAAQKQDKDGFRIFDTPEEGRQELIAQLQRDMVRMPNATPEQYFEHYSPNNAPGNGPGTSEAYAAAARKAAGVEIPAASSEKYKSTDLVAAVKRDPMLADALVKFQAFTNRTGSYGQAIEELGKTDPQAATRIAELYGGRQAVNQYDQDKALASEQAKDRIKANEQLSKEAASRAAKESEQYDTYLQDAKDIAGDPNDPGSGDMQQLDKLISQRTADRPKVYRMIKDINPNWSPAEAETKLDVWKDYTTDKGKTSGLLQSFNAFYGHVADALDSNENYRRMGRSASDYLNKPLTWWDSHAGELGDQEDYARFRASLEPAKNEWMTFLSNQHALTERDKELADRLVSDTQTPATAEATLKEMARTAAIRLGPINDKWKRIFSRDFPDLLNQRSVDAIQLMNDPVISDAMGNMQSGGYIFGSSNGRGTPGKTVNQILGKQPTGQQQQGGAAPEGTIVKVGDQLQIKQNGKWVPYQQPTQ